VRVRGGSPGDWRGVIRPSDPDAWWRSYGRFVLAQARLAARERVELFAIGSELTSMTVPEHAARWGALARSVREVYPGPLTVSLNHDALDRTAPVAHVDVVGVSAYFPLADDPDASGAELRLGWARAAARLRALAARTAKPLVLLEVGYPSMDGGAVRPWDYTTSAPIDLLEQHAAYRAFVDTATAPDASFLRGAFAWTWLGPGGPHDRWYTPRDKPAERELRRLLRHATTR